MLVVTFLGGKSKRTQARSSGHQHPVSALRRIDICLDFRSRGVGSAYLTWRWGAVQGGVHAFKRHFGWPVVGGADPSPRRGAIEIPRRRGLQSWGVGRLLARRSRNRIKNAGKAQESDRPESENNRSKREWHRDNYIRCHSL